MFSDKNCEIVPDKNKKNIKNPLSPNINISGNIESSPNVNVDPKIKSVPKPKY